MDYYAHLKQMLAEALYEDEAALLWALNAIERCRTEATFMAGQIDELHAANRRLEWELRLARLEGK